MDGDPRLSTANSHGRGGHLALVVVKLRYAIVRLVYQDISQLTGILSKMTDLIRNFAIVAHIDHGKSTLADRLLEKTGAVKVGSGEQLLDTMDLERERGITIKLNPARLAYAFTGKEYQFNLIDTPGHADFGYEVSRSLAAVEGVILLVDATQGVQAQTISNLEIARQLKLAIVPVVNKIDLPTAQIAETTQEIAQLLNCDEGEIVAVSAKTGAGVDELMAAIIKRIPPPTDQSKDKLQALVFDSFFDQFLGVIAYVKIVSGQLAVGQKLTMLATDRTFSPSQLGAIQLKRLPRTTLKCGEIGYLATGLKTVADCRVGDTVTVAADPGRSLSGYREPLPLVLANIFPEPGEDRLLAVALGKLKLNDASLTYQPTHSQALGMGFTVGCLGLLHLEIVKERLEREYDLTVLVTTPTVEYRFEDQTSFEPWISGEIVSPQAYFGAITQLIDRHRGVFHSVEYLGSRLLCRFQAPLIEIIIDFNDALKSSTAGYGSMDYQFLDYRPVDLVTVDLVINGEKIDALSRPIIKSRAESYGRQTVERLKELIPRQNFEVAVQAAIGGKIIARETVPAVRKDVTAKLYGGDVSRKKKLLEKQKKGKKRLKLFGRVEIPSEVFVDLLKKN
ncbi:MAG: GTP-binding protein [Patescibacteria group bacterium]